MKLLLISNSIEPGRSYLDHCLETIEAFVANPKEILFVPFALGDMDHYVSIVQKALSKVDIKVASLHRLPDQQRAIERAEAVFVGGGNTFRLLDTMYSYNLMAPLRERVIGGGACYIGSSAGANLACDSIKTTNDMPIVHPPSLDGLRLVPFNINPHYFDTHPEHHMGESRETRIKEFHELNRTPVLAMREGAWILIEGKSILLQGRGGARLFRQGCPAEDLVANSDISGLIKVDNGESLEP